MKYFYPELSGASKMTVYYYVSKNTHMKKIILSSIASVFLFSCSNQTDVAREKIEDHIDSFAHDPDSYQFVRMEKPDTTKKSDTIRWSAELDSFSLYYNNQVVDLYKGSYQRYLSSPYLSDMSGDQLQKYNFYKKKSDSLENCYTSKRKKYLEISKLDDKDSVIYINYKCTCRIKNASGGLILTSASITFIESTKTWVNARMERP